MDSPRRLDPKLDLVFKLLLTRRAELLVHMLEGVLGRPIRTVTVKNPEIPGVLASDKGIVLDLRVVLDDGTRVDLEMQIRLTPALTSRLVYYGARDYVDQLDRGDAYERLAPTAVIAWLAEPLFPTLERLHAIFELRERHTQLLFGDQLTIHVLQLCSSSTSTCATGYDARVERWARFLMHFDDDAEIDRLAAEDPMMHVAKQTLEELSQDPDTRRQAREREDAIKLYRIDLATVRAEGRTAGRTEGKAELLLRQLGKRFGPLSARTRALVEGAAVERLDAWADRVVIEPTLERVLELGAADMA
ncbi:Rpn family recombination-promoting nuclease/putative transposase [Paraliomyxa miuraensis]|uniref:Rpn family recombination-promoting nuclease/putative transposase n=1 Tax=Paraliomyxa miuraensis TaxID=376150 RepID=UPI00225BF562|nr:Rpn family recombination-promoting nuclease/putative transposase [Paraliomyxa miuraensis]MCX4245755.1 Rpn family recombination-promoting nuclease/putative transposase [Paraliomyxa miuraensis]